MTGESSPAAIVSASSDNAPIGVLSSWLTLATKSRRTLSTRRSSETSRTNATAPITRLRRHRGAVRTRSDLAGWTEQLELALRTLAPQRRREQRAHRVLDEGVRMTGAAKALAGGVAHDLVAPGVHDDHAVLERRHRAGERLTLDVAALAAALPPERLVQLLRHLAELAPQRPDGEGENAHCRDERDDHDRHGDRDDQPNLPVMYPSVRGSDGCVKIVSVTSYSISRPRR